jgi:hypothetical protein
MEDVMGVEKSKKRITVDALHLATEWKHLFSKTLREAAQDSGQDSEQIDIEHYRTALPVVIDRLKQLEQTPTRSNVSIDPNPRFGFASNDDLATNVDRSMYVGKNASTGASNRKTQGAEVAPSHAAI